MKVFLVFPPLSDPGNPPLGIALLAAHLKARGEHVRTLDLNIRCYRDILRRDNMLRFALRVEKKLVELDSQSSLDLDGVREYLAVSRAALRAEEVIQSVEGAIHELTEPATYSSRTKYSAATRTIMQAMELVAAAHYPSVWTPHRLVLGRQPSDACGVLAAACDRKSNFLIPFFEGYISEIARGGTCLVGISINYFNQLIPGITLAVMLKAAISDVVIVVGGTLVSMYRGRWESLRYFTSVVDAFVPFEGERPLVDLVQAIREHRSLATVPGVLHFQGGKAILNKRSHVQKAPIPPDFDDFTLRDYLAPRPVLPYATSRGCYWAKCSFCSQHMLYNGRRESSCLDRIVHDLEWLSQRYGVSDFYFVDEAIPPTTAQGLSKVIHDNGLGWHWFGEVRFEPILSKRMLRMFANGGCVMLLFGLESVVPHVLSAMEKGTNSTVMARVLDGCARAGIRTMIMFFFGFPGESHQDAEKTIAFVELHAEHITHISLSSFVLLRGTRTYIDPHAFGLSIVDASKEDDLAIHCRYLTCRGMSNKEAADMVAQAKERPSIRSLLEFPLITRNHLAFLPRRTLEEKRLDATPVLTHEYRPHLTRNLRVLNLNYDLEELGSFLRANINGDDGEHSCVKPRSTEYLYDLESERLVEIEGHGMLLLELCDGRRTVSDILGFVGLANRNECWRFFNDLLERRLI